MRPLSIKPGKFINPEGSCLISMGQTQVLCNATVEDRVPPFLLNTGKGWVTAEYGMLPRSTTTRMQRERAGGRPNSRSLEISRLIGRSMRAAVDVDRLGPRTVILDCDVLQADGGTRCCAVNGAVVALHLALEGLVKQGILEASPMHTMVAAVSVGIVSGKPALDLDYARDSEADVDLNVVMTAGGEFIELQGTGEKSAFSRGELDTMLELAWSGIEEILCVQRKALGL